MRENEDNGREENLPERDEGKGEIEECYLRRKEPEKKKEEKRREEKRREFLKRDRGRERRRRKKRYGRNGQKERRSNIT